MGLTVGCFPLANTTVIATGKAADNSAVTNVYYQLNGGKGVEKKTTESILLAHGVNSIYKRLADASG